MDKIKVLVVEDDLLTAENIKEALEEQQFSVTECVATGEEAIISYSRYVPDLIIMDIKLGGRIDGITTATKILEFGQNTPIIYLTDHVDNDTVGRAKNTYPANYLAKPFRTSDLLRALELAFSNVKRFDKYNNDKTILRDRIFVRVNHQQSIMIPYDDIIYIKAGRAYSTIYTKDNKHVLSSSMKKVIDQFNHTDFRRVHRSHFVNIKKVTAINGINIKLIGGHEIKMGDTYKNSILEIFNVVK